MHGHAEVGQVGVAVGVEQDVGRLDVAVDDALAVGGGEGIEQVVGEPADLVGCERSLLVDPLGEVAARQEVHDEDDVVALVEHFAQLHDPGVVQLLEHLGLAPDALAGLVQLLGRPVQREALERHLLAVGAAGEIDDAHAAAADAADDLVGHGARVGGPCTGAAAAAWPCVSGRWRGPDVCGNVHVVRTVTPVGWCS